MFSKHIKKMIKFTFKRYFIQPNIFNQLPFQHVNCVKIVEMLHVIFKVVCVPSAQSSHILSAL